MSEQQPLYAIKPGRKPSVTNQTVINLIRLYEHRIKAILVEVDNAINFKKSKEIISLTIRLKLYKNFIIELESLLK